MKHKLLLKVLKWILCGVIISVLVNAAEILFIYTDQLNVGAYLLPILSAVLTCLMLKEDKISKQLLAFGVMLISVYLATFILLVCGVTNPFYYSVNPDSTEISMGEGVIFAYLFGMSQLGVIVGFIIRFVAAVEKKHKDKNNSSGIDEV